MTNSMQNWTAFTLITLAGCDAADGTPVDAKALDLTPETVGLILEAANEASFEELDVTARLDARAAQGIVDFRVGPDDLLFTADDVRFASLEELDAIPYVGTTALGLLYEYASTLQPEGVSVHGITEGSAKAEGILLVANTLSEADLDTAVGLDARAAKAIVLARAEVPLRDLAELDAVPYVGAAAFADLLAWAEDNGLVREEANDLPFADCTGEFTASEVQAAYRAGSWMPLHLEAYTRECDEDGGDKTCTDWAKGELVKGWQMYGWSTTPQDLELWSTKVVLSGSQPKVELKNAKTTYAWGAATVSADGKTLDLVMTYRGYTDMGWGYDYWDKEWMTLTGSVSESCVSLATDVARSHEIVFSEGVRSYTETVTIARH